MAGKLYIGGDAATFAYLGEQCVYELVTGPKDITVTFNFTSTVTAPIYIYSGSTQLAQLSSAPYTFTGHTGDRITWRTSKMVDGVTYRAFGSMTLLDDVTQNVNMLPFYRVTFNWIEPTSSYTGYHYAGITGYYGGQVWEDYGTTEYSQGTMVEYMAGADGYYSVNSSYGPITGHTAIPIQLQSTNTGYTVQYLTFEVLSAGTIVWGTTSAGKTISISVNNGAWTTKTSADGGTLGTFSVGDKIRLKGTNSTYDGSYFDGGTALYNIYGNIGSLIYGDNFTGQTSPTVDAAGFRQLFRYSRAVSAENLVMPFTSLPASACTWMFTGSEYLTKAPHLTATSVGNCAYHSMFEYCTKLATPPGIEAESLGTSACTRMFQRCYSLASTSEFKATTLGNGCYSYMYGNCSGLTSAESLPATALTDSCYELMFAWCTSLTTPPALPATTLASRCYLKMFQGCSSLTTTPTLAATAMTFGCYGDMFAGCTSLTTPPSLPATTLAVSCYGDMFSGCTSLSTAPTLAATALTESCYGAMFAGCTSLTTAPSLPATTLANYCYESMFAGCTNLTTAPILNAPTLVEGCYMDMFRNCNSLTSIRVLATNGIDTNDSTFEWVSGITTTGTLYVAQGMTNAWLPRGANRCPINWTPDGGVVNVTLTITANQANSTVYISTDGGSTWPQRSTVTVPAGTTVQYKLSNASLGDNGCAGIAKSYTVNATTSITDDVYVQYTVSVAPTATTFHSNYEAQDIFVSSSLTTYQGVDYKTMTIATPYKTTNSLYFTHPNFTAAINFIGPFDGKGDTDWGYRIMNARVTFSVTPSNATKVVATGTTPNFSPSSPTTLSNNYVDVEYGKYLWYTINKAGYISQSVSTPYPQITGDTTINATLQTTLISFYISASDGGNLENQTSYEITAGNAYVSLYQGPYHPVAKYDAYQFAWNDNYGFTIKISADGYQDYTYVMPAGDPGVSFISIVLSPAAVDYSKQYLTFKVTSPGTIAFKATGSTAITKTIEYSKNNGSWTSITSSTASTGTNMGTFATGDEIRLRGTNTSYASGTSRFNTFVSTAQYEVYGNVASIINGDSFTATTPTLGASGLTMMFSGSTGITSAENMVIPFSIPNRGCYRMFYFCTRLTKAPQLKGSSIGTLGCYQMFYGCTQLTTPPAFSGTSIGASGCTQMFNGATGLTSPMNLTNVTTGNNYAYYGMYYSCSSLTSGNVPKATSVGISACTQMFYACTSLVNAPVSLPATNITSSCYYQMFYNCTSLTTAPALPATTLAAGCYREMFAGTKIVNAPTLTATSLPTRCYQGMFSGCTELTNVVSGVPATTVNTYCCAYMFDGCSKLNYMTGNSLQAATLANYCYQYMFRGCSKFNMPPSLPATALTSNCYAYMFYGCSQLDHLSALFTTTPGNNYTSNWLSGVASTGTFYANSSATWPSTITKGVSTVPTGWNFA